MAIKSVMKEENFDRAETLIKEALALFPNSEDLLLNQGVVYQAKG